MRRSPLKDLRVIDFSHSWAAPHCARILADFGADVIKVEYVKRLCILRGARKEKEIYNTHPAWRQVNRNKSAVTLDLDKPEDHQALMDLAMNADVFIENSRPGVLEKLGFGYTDLSAANEDIIMLSMSAFGATGSFAQFAGYGAVFEAVSGIQSLTGYRNGPPQRIREMDITNGIAGAGAVMTALLHRQKTGQGQYIDLSQLEAASHAMIGEHLLGYAARKNQESPRGNRHVHFAPQGCYPCKGKDKWIVITIRSEEEWQRFCSILGDETLIEDSRFINLAARHQNHDDLDGIIASYTQKYDNGPLMSLLQKEKIPAAAVLDMQEVSVDPHLQERHYFITNVAGTDKRFMGMPFTLSRGKGILRWPGPDLGQHNQEILVQVGKKGADTISPIRQSDIRTAFDID
ncbi:MAG: CoA transferase [Desulfobulbaceae bacterium]|nr:CoA transferase [Desulfobulbaceae bacterium]